MWRCSLLLLCVGAAGCVDWQALYAGRPAAADAGEDAPVGSSETEDAQDDPEVPAIPPIPVEPDASPFLDAAACDDTAADPIIDWRFAGHDRTSLMNIPDSACRAPEAPLYWAPDRKPGNTMMAIDAVYMDGGFLEVPIPANGRMDEYMQKTKSFSIELWFRPVRTESGTIFTTNEETDGDRAFALSQQTNQIRFVVRTTATNPSGDKFMTGTPSSAEVIAALPPEAMPPAPVHLVALFAAATATASIYIDGKPVTSVSHLMHGGAAMPVPVWSKNHRIGVGGTFPSGGTAATSWKGWIHRIAIYDRALGADEITTLSAVRP